MTRLACWRHYFGFHIQSAIGLWGAALDLYDDIFRRMHNSELHKFPDHPRTSALLYYVTNRKRGGGLCQYVISGNCDCYLLLIQVRAIACQTR